MCRATVPAYPTTIAPSPADPMVDQKDTPTDETTDAAGVILATRYKTKMCLSIEQGEECPYQNRCMFAHSEEELRTKEQNLADGITTETAIREHRRRVHMQIKQRNKRKEKRREKQLKKQQLREMEAQGITLPDYSSSPIPEQEEEQSREMYSHNPYAFPFSTTASQKKIREQQQSFEGADSEGQSAGGETDSHHNSSGAASPRRHSSSSSSCIISFDSSDFYRHHQGAISPSSSWYSSSSSPSAFGGWSHNPYPRVLFYQE